MWLEKNPQQTLLFSYFELFGVGVIKDHNIKSFYLYKEYMDLVIIIKDEPTLKAAKVLTILATFPMVLALALLSTEVSSNFCVHLQHCIPGQC